MNERIGGESYARAPMTARNIRTSMLNVEASFQ